MPFTLATHNFERLDLQYPMFTIGDKVRLKQNVNNSHLHQVFPLYLTVIGTPTEHSNTCILQGYLDPERTIKRGKHFYFPERLYLEEPAVVLTPQEKILNKIKKLENKHKEHLNAML